MLERAWLDEMAAAMSDTMVGTLGLKMVSAAGDSMVIAMPYAKAITSLGGAVHAGALVGLATTAAYLAVLNHESYDGTSLPVLASSSLMCLGPATDDVLATTRVVIHRGPRVLVEVMLRSQTAKIALVQTEFRCQ